MSDPTVPLTETSVPTGRSLRFNRMEWAGSLGDLGTLIPFLIAYTVVAKVPAFGILLCFGVALIAIIISALLLPP